ACFVRPGEIALGWTDNVRDVQHAISLDAWERLQAAVDAKGRRLKVHKIPMPRPLSITAKEAAGVVSKEGTKPRPVGDRLAESYLILHNPMGRRAMPPLDPKIDRGALAKQNPFFPEGRVVGAPPGKALRGGGKTHSTTQQAPRPPGAKKKN